MTPFRATILSVALCAGLLMVPTAADAEETDTAYLAVTPSGPSDFASMTPEEIYAAKTQVTHEELMEQLGVAEPNPADASTLAAASGCVFASDGDDVHATEYGSTLYASGHGYWWRGTCPTSYRADVTIFLEEKLGGSWYPQGNAVTGYNRNQGSGSSQRVTAKMACVNFSLHQWRSVVVADIVGHADTAPAAYTPVKTLNCYQQTAEAAVSLLEWTLSPDSDVAWTLRRNLVNQVIDLSEMNDTDPAWRVTVDGELWEVRKSAGQYHFAWLSGIAADYGFTSRLSDPEFVLSSADIESTIREFMGNVNPETGYLD